MPKYTKLNLIIGILLILIITLIGYIIKNGKLQNNNADSQQQIVIN
jgi:flagellar motor component MotA